MNTNEGKRPWMASTICYIHPNTSAPYFPIITDEKSLYTKLGIEDLYYQYMFDDVKTPRNLLTGFSLMMVEPLKTNTLCFSITCIYPDAHHVCQRWWLWIEENVCWCQIICAPLHTCGQSCRGCNGDPALSYDNCSATSDRCSKKFYHHSLL